MSAFAVLAVAVALFVTGASLLRFYLSDGRLIILLAALAIFTLGNLLMVRIMRDTGGLGPAISLATLGQLILANVVAVLLFGERPPTLQVVGIGLGIMAVALILMPTIDR
jgi:glucose uptake protein